MAYNVASAPGGLLFAPTLLTLGQQIASHPRYAPFVTNLGQASDPAHRAQGSSSDHNPWLYNMVRAMDFGVVNANYMYLLYEIRDMWNALYARRDPRCYSKGYTNGPDSLGTDWDRPGQLHTMGGDDRGHLHISAPQDLAGCNNTSAWPLVAITGSIAASIIAPPPTTTEEDDMSQEDVTEIRRMLACLVNPGYAAAHSGPGEYRLADQVWLRPIVQADGKNYPAEVFLRDGRNDAGKAAMNSIDIGALSTAIAAKLPTGGSSPTLDQIKAASADVLRDVLGSLDNPSTSPAS